MAAATKSATVNTMAMALKALHISGKPLVVANVYDILSARAVAALPSCTALATASYAIARAAGTEDDDMTFEQNLAAIKGIARVAQEFGMPLTVDIQDAYGRRLEEVFGALVSLGVAGANLEDCDKETQKMYSQAEAVTRIKRALSTAKQHGMPDFVINTRCDTLLHGAKLQEVIQRGEAYLDAHAATVFVWGGSKRGVSREEVVETVKAFDGRLNVAMKLTPDGLNVKQLAQLGVARISVGPQIQMMAMETFAKEAENVLLGQ